MAYQFPVSAIRKIILEEFDLKTSDTIDAARKVGICTTELREICSEHRKKIKELDTYEQINDFLTIFRHLNLQEWIDSL